MSVRGRLRSAPLQRRVALLTAVAVALAVAVTGAAAYLTTRLALYQQLDDELLAIAQTAAGPLAADPALIDDLTGANLQIANVSVAVLGADNTVHVPPEEQIVLRPGAPELAVAKLGSGSSARTTTASNGAAYRTVAVPVGDEPGYALVLGRPLGPTSRILSSLSLVLLIFGGAGVFWAATAGAAVARSGLAPVRRLTAAFERVTQTNTLTPVAISGSDELSRLAVAFNRMISSLSRSRERQSRLIADAGHELRTPLTSLRTNIELLAADQSSQLLPAEARREIIADVTAQLGEFSALVGDLVQLARDDQVAPAPEPIDVRTVVEAAVERARRRGPGLQFDVELDPLYLVGEPDSLERAVTNLLDNAVKFSPPGGTVRVHLEGDRLRIADQGPGIPDEDLPFVFDRFFRSERARHTPGTGLGLSIVAQTVARHGGWVRAGRSAQGGAEFTVRLPGSTSPDGLDGTDGPPDDSTPRLV